MARVGVILSGCGVYDGSEIHEAVLILLSLNQRGAVARCLSIDKPFKPINHVTQKSEHETRNMLAESARIARGEVEDLAKVDLDEFDAFILPGGFGAAQELCSFAVDGAECEVDETIREVLTQAHAAEKPLGFACISPVIAAKLFGEKQVKLTIGHDEEIGEQLASLGADVTPCDVSEVVADDRLKIASTPAYMEAGNLTELHVGLDKLVAQILEWSESAAPSEIAAP